MEGDFRIDQWLVQPQLNAIVSPDNATVQLEPKVMEVLVFLSEQDIRRTSCLLFSPSSGRASQQARPSAADKTRYVN
jgi:hypothetical protein